MIKSNIQWLRCSVLKETRRDLVHLLAMAATVLLLFAACFVSPAVGAEGRSVKRIKPPVTGFVAVGDIESNIYVPYEDLAELIDPAGRAMLMDRDEFEKLLAAAKENASAGEARQLGQVGLAQYTATVSGDKVTLVGQLKVFSMSDKAVAVNLGFSQLGLTTVTLDGKDAPLGYDSKGRLTLVVTGQGTHELKVEGSTRLKELATGGMQFSISLPEAVAGTVQLMAPGDLEIHSTVAKSKPVYDKSADQTSVELTIGGQKSVTVVLLGNGRRDDDQAILLAESATTVNLTRSHQVMSCLYTVQSLRRGVRELQFDLGREWTITEVTCPSLLRWSVKDVDGGKRLSVHLRSAKVGTTALRIKATAFRSGLQWQGPRISLVDASFQRGLLMVETDEGLRVRAEEVGDARRQDAARASVRGIVATSAGRLYSHWGDNWHVNLELATVSLRRSIKESQNIEVGSEQVTVTGDFEVTAVDRELFEISLELGGQQWNIKEVRVDGQDSGFEYRVLSEGDNRVLSIELARPVLPEKVANVRVVLQHVPGQWLWPSDASSRSIKVPLIRSMAETVSGHVSISALGDLDAVAKAAPSGLKRVPVGRMQSLGLPHNSQYAYSYESAASGDMELEVSRRRPRIAADSVGLISARPKGLSGVWRITYSISRATAKRLYLLADKSLEQRIRISSSSVRISSKNIVVADETTLPLSAELGGQYNLWLINLDHASLGNVVIDVQYEVALEGDQLSVPLVRPICQGQQDETDEDSSQQQGQTNELLAVQASEELAVTVESSGTKDIDAIDLPRLPAGASRILTALRLEPATTASGSRAAVTMRTTIHENYGVPSALAVSSQLLTYVDIRGKQRTQAQFEIANAGRQFLTFRLPEDAQLWSLEVAGEQAKPQRDAKGDYQVPLQKSRKPVAVRVVYAYEPDKIDLDKLELGGIEIPGVEINKLQWDVVPPPGYQITSQETQMQTSGLVKPKPAYLQICGFLREYMFGGSVFQMVPSLGVEKAQRTGLGRDEGYLGDRRTSVTSAGDALVEAATKYSHQAKSDPVPVEAPEPTFVGTPKSVAKPSQGVKRRPRPQRELMRHGRYTLPVNLVPTVGAGPRAGFNSLGTSRLIIGLGEQSKQQNWPVVGFLLVLVLGMAAMLEKARVKASIIVMVLAVSSLLAIWWPGMTYFANGVFMAGVCLIPFYLLVCLIRWLWPKMRFGPSVNGEAATAVVLLVCLLAFGFSSRPADAATDSIKLPHAIYPYKSGANEAEKSGKVLVPYSRFVELWNQAYPQDPIDGLKPGTDVSFADARYAVTVEGEELKLHLTAQIATYGKEWVVLSLPVDGLAVTSVTVDGKPAQWQGVHDGKRADMGMTIMLPGGTSGELKLSAVTTPKYFGRRGSVSFSLPPLPAASMTVLLPETDLELEVDGIEGILSSRKVKNKIEWTVPLGMTRKLSLRWLPKVGEGAADRTLSAESNHDVYAYHWATVGVTRIKYSFSAGEHDRFTLLVPTGATVTSLKGANVRDYRSSGEKTIDGKVFDLIRVRLHRPAKKTYDLTVRWLGELPSLGEASRLFLLQAGDISRESGRVTVHAAEGMKVKVSDVSGGRRESVETRRRKAASSGGIRAVVRFYWPYRPFALSVELSRSVVSPEVNLDQLIRVNTDEIQLLVQASLKAEQGKLFGASFTLPKGYELLSAVGPVVENYFERTNEKGRFVHIKFSSAVNDTQIAFVLVRSDIAASSTDGENILLDDFSVPTIMYVDSQGIALPEQKGRIAVQVAPSLEAQTLISEKIKAVVPRVLRGWLDNDQASSVQFAYRYESSDALLHLKIRPEPTEIRVETFASMVVRTTAAMYTYRLRYEISGSAVDILSLQMPSEYASLVAIESPAMRSISKSDAGGGKTQWDISLASEVTGTVDVTVNFSLQIDETTKQLKLPRVETTAPQGYHGIAAVQNISRHKIKVSGITNLEELSVSDQRKLLSPQMMKSLQYVYHSYEDNWSLGLDFTAAEPAARIQAVVDLLSTTTVIDRNGRCRYEARIALQNRSEQFLTVDVPKGLRLWSAKVAGQAVKPVTEADSPETQVLIPLVKTSPGGLPYEVYLYFADDADKPLVNALEGITQLKPPSISIVGIPVMQTTWSLRLPAGYRYVRPGGNMSAVAGTVEMWSLGIEAKLEQLQRLDETYRDVAGSSDQKERVTYQNWHRFNKKLGEDIQQAQHYLESNRDEVSREDYDRLKSKLGKQVVFQNSIMVGNSEFVERQQDQAGNNLNVWLNDAASNAGVSEVIRNGRLVQKPGFVAENERRQMERLQQELKASEAADKTQADDGTYFELGVDSGMMSVGSADQKWDESGNAVFDLSGSALVDGERLAGGGTDVVIYGDAKIQFEDNWNVRADKDADVKSILKELKEENAEKIAKQRKQLRQQLGQNQYNRSQRYFERQNQIAPQQESAQQPQAHWESKEQFDVRGRDYAGRRIRGSSSGRRGGVQSAGVPVLEPSGSGFGGGAYSSGISTNGPASEEGMEAIRGVALGLTTRTDDMDEGEALGWADGATYVATGTYSLPVSLPAGQVRLDFARPMGGAELSIWAVPADTTRNLYAGVIVIIALVVSLAVIKYWPQGAGRQPISPKRMVVYVVLVVIPAVAMGLIGLIVGTVVVGAIEIARTACANRVDAA